MPAPISGSARSRPANQDNILGVFHEGAAVQLTDGGFIDFAGFEVKACEVFVGRKACHLGLVGNGANFALCNFRLEKLGQHRRCRFERWCTLHNQIINGLRHAMQLQATQHDHD